MPKSRAAAIAATAQLEGWRLPVAAALQPVLVLDDELRLVAASSAAASVLLLPRAGRPISEAGGLQDVLETWEELPFVVAVRSGQARRGLVRLPSAGAELDVVASPLFGPEGAIGALVFLTAC